MIVVCKPRDEEYSGFDALITVNSSEMYAICGLHVCGECNIDSYYPLSKHSPSNKWFKFNDEGIIEFDIPMLFYRLLDSSEKVVLTIYEKIIDNKDVDMEKYGVKKTNLLENPVSGGDKDRA